MTQRAPKAKLDALDGLRGFAASFVVLHHMATNQLLPAHPILLHGGRLVDTFFVISGFVMAYQYGDRLTEARDLGKFVRRRFARIWPLHAAILAAMMAPRLVGVALHGGDAELMQVGGDHSLGSWIASLALIHGMGIYDHAVWNGPSWTISVEFFVYFIFAFSAMANGRWLYSSAVAILALTALVLVSNGMYLSTPIQFSFLRCLFGFFCGVSMLPLFRLVSLSGIVNRVQATAAEGIFFTLAALLLWFSPKGVGSFVFVLVCGLLTVALALRRGPLSQALTTKPIQALGSWSLGIYLLHIPVLNILMRISRHAIPFGLNFTASGWHWPETIIFLAIVLVLAAAGYYLVETPARDRLGGRSKPKPCPASRRRRWKEILYDRSFL
ncbi:acyltransferase family protein [Novosphingobium sp. 11B]